MELEDLAGPEEALVAEQLWQVADPGPGGDIAGRRSEHRRVATRRTGEAEEELDRGRLARAVRAEEAEYLAPLDVHRQAGERLRPPVPLCELDDLDRRTGHGRHRDRQAVTGGSQDRVIDNPTTRMTRW